MKPLTLTRKVELEKYELLMEIGRQESREELNAILKLAQELGGRVTASDICDQLLIGRPEQVGRAILDRCRYLDLLDDNGSLTKIGHESLLTGEVFVPERGRYLLWYTDDPLLPSGVLHLEAKSESSLYDEISIQIYGENHDSARDTSEQIPEKIKSLEGRPFSIFGKGGGRIHVRQINSNGIHRKLDPQDNLRAQLVLIPNQPANVSFEGKFRIEGTRPDIRYESYWLSALGPYADFWEITHNNPALKTSYRELGEKELFTFKKMLHLTSPKLPTYGVLTTQQYKRSQ